MWRNATCAVGGLLAACAAAYVFPISQAQSASFEERWQAVSPALKGDRIQGPAIGLDRDIHFFELPTMQTTVVVKGRRKPPLPTEAPMNKPVLDDQAEQPNGATETRNGSMRQTPVMPVRVVPHDAKGERKLPVGCESSFSPVTVPGMAHVSSRCLS